MKFTLKEYQDEAVRDVLDRLRDARDDWHRERPRRSGGAPPGRPGRPFSGSS